MPISSPGGLAAVTPEGWGVLALLVLAAVLIDYVLVRVALDFAKPATQYVFLVGRVGKLGSLAAWCAGFTLWWYPRYLSETAPQMLINMETAIWIALALLSVAVMPRMPKPRPETASEAARPGGIHA